MPNPNPISRVHRAPSSAPPRTTSTRRRSRSRTADADGRPSVRIVLLRGVDERGFVFHTNYKSRKARELDANPVRGAVLSLAHARGADPHRGRGRARLPADESDAYFAGRPRGSQLGAWASAQSEILGVARDVRRSSTPRTEARFAGQPVPRPPFWGGFRIDPSRDRVLVRTHRQAARSDSLCAGGDELDGSTAVSLSARSSRERRSASAKIASFGARGLRGASRAPGYAYALARSAQPRRVNQ